MDTLELANDYVNMEWEDFEAKHGEELKSGGAVITWMRTETHRKLCGRVFRSAADGKVRLRDGQYRRVLRQPGNHRTHALPETASPGRR